MARVGAELRRQDFVEATVKVIAEHGVANATTRRIAAAAGCPLASLHYVFHTKDDLLYAVYESLFNLPHQALT
ncbi:TetR family transcriptional regulator, partial [Pseudomonas sp. P5_A2_2]